MWRLPSAAPRAGEAGQGLVEFGVILALVFVVAAILLVFFSPQLSFVLSLIGAGIEGTS